MGPIVALYAATLAARSWVTDLAAALRTGYLDSLAEDEPERNSVAPEYGLPAPLSPCSGSPSSHRPPPRPR